MPGKTHATNNLPKSIGVSPWTMRVVFSVTITKHSHLVDVLEQIGSPAVEPLIAALGNQNRFVRYRAAQVLGNIKDERAVEPLISVLSDEHPVMRYTAASALGNIGDKRAVEPLIAALGDTEADVRRFVAEALGEIGDARAVEPLIAALRDENVDVRANVVRALGKIGDIRAVKPLFPLLLDIDTEQINVFHPSICDTTASALEKIGTPEALEALRRWRAGEL
ncbi:MAG: HEAT repeat domain-containing protein [bacterium]|nr:HEAT repeat domain-containing protein [bacterium]